MRSQQGFPDACRLVSSWRSNSGDWVVVESQGVAHEGEAVGVQTVGGDADERVAFTDGRAVQDVVLFDDADREAGQVELTLCEQSGKLGGLPADEGAPVLRCRPT